MPSERIKIQGEGSIREYKKGRVYYIRHRLPPTEPGGERRWSPSRKVYGNKARARQELEAYRKELEAELNGEVDSTTVGTYAEQFHEHRAESKTVALRTIERESYEIERIRKTLGDKLLTKLTAADIVDAYSKLRSDGASQNTINSTHAKLSQILEKAFREGRISRNPCKLIDSVEVRRDKTTTRRSLSAEQFSQLGKDLLEAKLDGKIVAIWIAMAVGGRRGEILGLEWEDINLSKRTISFNAQLTPKQGRILRLKTDSSRRVCAIDGNTATFLANWKTFQSEAFYDGGQVPETAPVCCSETGRFMSLSGFDRWRRRFFVEHGLGSFKVVEEYRGRHGEKRYRFSGYEGFCLHELRHSQATLLISDKVDPKTVQARGGWASIDVPMNIYTHAVESNDREAAETIGKRLPKVKPIKSVNGNACKGTEEEANPRPFLKNALKPDDILVEKHRHRCSPIPKAEAEQRILAQLSKSPTPLSKRDLSKLCGITSEKCLATTLQSLQAKGTVSKIGNTKSTRYEITTQFKAQNDRQRVNVVTDVTSHEAGTHSVA